MATHSEERALGTLLGALVLVSLEPNDYKLEVHGSTVVTGSTLMKLLKDGQALYENLVAGYKKEKLQ